MVAANKGAINAVSSLKRKYPNNAELLEDADLFGKVSAALLGISTRFNATKPDPAAFDTHCNELVALQFDLPMAFRARRASLLALESIRFTHYDDFVAILKSKGVHSSLALPPADEGYASFVEEVVELGLSKIAPSGGRYALSDEELRERIQNFTDAVVAGNLLVGQKLNDVSLLKMAVTDLDNVAPSDSDKVVAVVKDALNKVWNVDELSILGGLVRNVSWTKMHTTLSAAAESRASTHARRSTLMTAVNDAVQFFNDGAESFNSDVFARLKAALVFAMSENGSSSDFLLYCKVFPPMSLCLQQVLKQVDEQLTSIFLSLATSVLVVGHQLLSSESGLHCFDFDFILIS